MFGKIFLNEVCNSELLYKMVKELVSDKYVFFSFFIRDKENYCCFGFKMVFLNEYNWVRELFDFMILGVVWLLGKCVIFKFF